MKPHAQPVRTLCTLAVAAVLGTSVGTADAARDTSPATLRLALSEGANPDRQHVRGASVVVNPHHSGSFTVSASAGDPQSGVESVTFPALLGEPALVDSRAPFTRTYRWTPDDRVPGRVSVVARNRVGLRTWTSFEVLADGTAPAAGSEVAYEPGRRSNTPVDVSVDLGPGDAGSGLAVRSLQRLTGASDDDCAWTSTTAVRSVTSSGTVPDPALRPGRCYSYRLLEVDRVGNERITNGQGRVVVNRAPQAVAGLVSSPEDGSTRITLQGVDADGDRLEYSLEDAPAHGELSGDGPDYLYTPARDYHGPDGLRFTVSDGLTSSSAAFVSIAVGPVNDAPVAEEGHYELDQATSVPFALAATDADRDALTYQVVDGPAHGRITGVGPDLVYTPDPAYSGPDTVRFRALDGQDSSALTAVTFSVRPVLPPLAVRQDRGVMSQGAPLATHPYVDHVTGGTSIRWSSLEPADQSFTGPGWAQLDRLMANPQVAGVRLRVYTGRYAPEFVKRLGGAPVSGDGYDCTVEGGIAVHNPYDKTGGCVPRFWEPQVLAQYEELMREVARRYDDTSKLTEVVNSACSTVYAEPFYRAHSHAASNARLWQEGLDRDTDTACHEQAMEIHQRTFPTTPVSLAVNAWEFMVDPAVHPSGRQVDWSATYEFASRWRAKLGQRLVLQNNGWGEDEGCPGGATARTNVYCYLASIDRPKGFQSETWSRLGDSNGGDSLKGWYSALERAIAQGACFVESTDNGYRNADPVLMAEYDRRLEANC